VAEDQLAIVGEVLVETKAQGTPTQQARERRLPGLKRLAPKILAIQL
jgi:hypothetical protein